MIRVNLLPQDEQGSSRSIKLPNFGAWAPLAILPVVLGLVGISATLNRAKLSTLRQDVAEVQEEVRRIQPQVDRVKKLTAKREELERRLEVIQQLDQDRFLAVRTMDELSRHLPRYLWLTDVTAVGPTRITVSGVTFSNLIVADLMMRLERSSMFAGVDLTQTERGEIDGRDVVQFVISGNVTPNEEPEDFTAGILGQDPITTMENE